MSLECKSSDSLFFVAMNRKTIDQTASELQLHRVLYLITFLRAMVLHVTLLLVAALLYFLTGIDNAYPVGTAALQAFRAQGIAYRVQGSAIGGLWGSFYRWRSFCSQFWRSWFGCIVQLQMSGGPHCECKPF
jgi:hypothetical protein